MTHVITRLCIRGGECIEVCPVSCIVPGPANNAEWPYLYIDPDGCIDCGACVPECPVEAIFPDFEVPAIYTEDIERNRQSFRKGRATGSSTWKISRKNAYRNEARMAQTGQIS